VEREVTVRIDTQPPLSSHTASPPQPASGWYSDTVTLTISATDDHSGWDGTIWYRLNGGAWQQTTNPAGVPVALSDPGVWEVSYYSRDRAGNAETPRVAGPYRIDRGRPTVTAAVSDPGEYVRPPVTISLSASDDEPGLITSGIERIEYRQVSGPGSGSAPWTRGDRVVIDGSLGDGAYVYEYRARDVAGNLSEVGRVTVRVDGTPPTQPTNLVATPTAWTKTNGQFGLCWANPSDFSGIAGIHYQINVDPAVTLIEGHPYVPLAGAQCLSNIAVVGDGQHTIYVWLQDRAGNHSRFQRAALQNAFKLDTLSPIHDPPAIQGSLGCDGKHYTGPVTLTFRARDTLSGVASFRYRVNAGAWSSVPAASPNVVLTAQGRHIVEYHASDVAGNEQPVAGSITIYVDSEPPAEPIRLGVTPVTWTASNSFSATWGNPTDYAGVKAAYYKIGAPPASAKDGLRIEGVGITRIDGITAPREGEATLYLWLEDAACNVDHTTARTAVLRYDPTPPVTQIVVEGTLGEGGYYVSPLKVRFQATDASSGVRQTYYRFNSDQAWRAWDGTDIIIGGEGSHRVSYYSEDNAANKEWPRQTDPYRIDLRPPSCDISVASGYVQSSSVVVRWSGRDTMSGVARYTVEYSQAKNGPWQTWLADTNETSGTFSNLQQNRQTFFRVRARDGAGHLSAWSSERMDCNDDVYREGLGNPSFDLCDFGAWKPEGALGMQVLYAPARESGSSCMARLSQEREYYKVPKDAYASISQLIEIPRLEGGRQLELSFWYRLLSYDMAWGLDVEDGQEKWFDPFFVYIRGSGGQELARYLPEGNLMDPSKWEEFRLWDPGWLPYRVDLTPWIGQTVSIEFRVWNLVDQQWATWVFVDDVRLQPAGPRCGSYVPLIVKGTGASGLLLSEEISPVPPTPQVVPEPLAEGRPQWAPGLPEPKSRK